MIRNAIILAAGTSSRFVPLSQETPKGLLKVKGEVLIERQIRQLQEAGISDITIVVGYKAEMFSYLKNKYGVKLVFNEDYDRFNNTSSLIRVLDCLGNTFICSSDNYFPSNVFIGNPEHSYYSALYASGETTEYCLQTDSDGNITDVSVGGKDAWYMVGHVYFSREFSESFSKVLKEEYELKEDAGHKYWEDIYISHIGELPSLKINKYQEEDIKEFDTLDELRAFDPSYINNTGSPVIKEIAGKLGCKEGDLSGFKKLSVDGNAVSFSFKYYEREYAYNTADKSLVLR